MGSRRPSVPRVGPDSAAATVGPSPRPSSSSSPPSDSATVTPHPSSTGALQYSRGLQRSSSQAKALSLSLFLPLGCEPTGCATNRRQSNEHQPTPHRPTTATTTNPREQTLNGVLRAKLNQVRELNSLARFESSPS